MRVSIENQNADGLGNQMFRIATGVAYAKRTGKTFCDKNRWKYRDRFKKYDFEINESLIGNLLYFEPQFKYTELPVYDQTDNITLCGYFQSEKYFADYKDGILNLFQFNPKKREEIFIHVRRGDYKHISDFLLLLGVDYYNKAIDIMKEKGYSKFIVLSDEMDLAQALFKDRKDVKISFSENTDMFEDLVLMESCIGGIIANSSFSWWGAYLQNSDNIIAPEKWFGERAHKQGIFEDDIIPKRWLKV